MIEYKAWLKMRNMLVTVEKIDFIRKSVIYNHYYLEGELWEDCEYICDTELFFSIDLWGTANISEILYAKLYFHLKKPKTCTLRIWLLKFNLYKVLKTYVLGIIFTCLKSIYFLTFLSAKTHYQKQSNIFIPKKCLWCYY